MFLRSFTACFYGSRSDIGINYLFHMTVFRDRSTVADPILNKLFFYGMVVSEIVHFTVCFYGSRSDLTLQIIYYCYKNTIMLSMLRTNVTLSDCFYYKVVQLTENYQN